jgi:hypothetical protein
MKAGAQVVVVAIPRVLEHTLQVRVRGTLIWSPGAEQSGPVNDGLACRQDPGAQHSSRDFETRRIRSRGGASCVSPKCWPER